MPADGKPPTDGIRHQHHTSLHHTMSDTPTPETDAAYIDHAWDMHGYIPLEFARKLERERDAANKELHQKYIEFDALFDEAEQIRIERDAALAANAELLERLRERTESHLAASARDVQTIQQQAVEIDRLKNILNHGQH
jgi:hypothetical protein